MSAPPNIPPDGDHFEFDPVRAAKGVPIDDPFDPRCERASDIPVTPGGERSPFNEVGTSETPPAGKGSDPGARDYTDEFAAKPAEPGGQQDTSGPTSDLDTRKVTVTVIKDAFGKSLRRVDMTLPQLAEHIRVQTAASKMELPWLKLAVFGSKPSDKGCLRTNENLERITGIEAEHDVGEISFEVAVATMREAGIRCIVYTSPSYVPAVKERWRVLVPLSKDYPHEVREKFVARVNGLLGGKLAPESFVLSQAYLYGHVEGAEHRVEVIDGDFLDLRDDTYAGSIFKDGSRVGAPGADHGSNGAGSQQRSHKDDAPEPVDLGKIEAALNVVSSDCSYEIWLKVGGALHHALGEAGFELFNR
jgi:hypothetical protein